MRYLISCFIALLFLSCGADRNTNKGDSPGIQYKSDNKEELQDSRVDPQMEEDNIGSAAMEESEKEKAKTLQDLTTPKIVEPSIYTVGKYYVISPNGLRMRAGPSLSDNVLGTIPYLEAIEILDIYNVKKDTLNKKVLESNKTIEEDYNTFHFKYNVIGDWVQVKYQEKIGYVFSAYLVKENHRRLKPEFTHAIQLIGRPPDGTGVHTKSINNWYLMNYQKKKHRKS